MSIILYIGLSILTGLGTYFIVGTLLLIIMPYQNPFIWPFDMLMLLKKLFVRSFMFCFPKKKKAATVLIITTNGFRENILAVSRKNDPNDFGLPGGALEKGETYEEAAIRETFEETGLKIFDLKCVFTRQDKEYKVKTFIPGKVYGEPKQREAGVVKYVYYEDLILGSFGKYNYELFKKLKMIK